MSLLLDYGPLALDAIGGALGKSSADKDRKMAQAQFDAQMDQTIQRRVSDAKKAGVHPLFALGASSGASPTLQAGGDQSASRAAGAAADKLAGLKAINASAARDEAEAALLNSERKRLEQDMNASNRDNPALVESPVTSIVEPVKTYPFPGNTGYKGPAEYYAPQVPFSSRPGVQAGVLPARIEVTDEMGNTYTLPNPELGQDEIGQIESILGTPDRVFNNIRSIVRKRGEVAKLERELEKLRQHRAINIDTPEKRAAFEAQRARVRKRIRDLYNKLKGYTK